MAVLLDKEPTIEHKMNVKHELLKEKISTMGPDDIHQTLNNFEGGLSIHMKGDSFTPLKIGFDIFCHDTVKDANGLPFNCNLDDISEKHRKQQTDLIAVFNHCKKIEIGKNEYPDITGNIMTLIDRVKRVVVMHNDAYDQVVLYIRQNTRINFPTIVQGEDIFRCTTMSDGEDKKSAFQELLLYILSTTSKMDYRRYKGQVCKQIGNTRAWKPLMPIADFIFLNTQKETKYDMWKNMTSKGTMVKDTVSFLTTCKDIQFPEIVKNRNVWSFKNGLFVGKQWDGDKYIHKFYTYDSQEFKSLDPTIISCKYFDQEFVDYTCDWYNIPTPHFQTVLDFQEFTEDACKWMYVFAGRLMFDTGDLDQWQVIPFFKGIARSGKSTLITKVFKKFYDPEDVRTLSNNVERKFGLMSIYDGFMFISPEIKGDLCLEQAEFQSIVSGEDISIARKYDTALSVTWKTPGVFAGNEVPGWRDNSGSIIRRMLTWNFGKQVQDADQRLDEKLDTEIPAIMLKCIRAYLEYSHEYSDRDIWTVVPEYFKSVQNQIAMVTSALLHFLNSEKVRFGADLHCPQRMFVQQFNSHCIENNLGKYKFNPDFYAGPFSSRKLQVVTESRTYQGKPYIMQSFIHGIDLVNDSTDFTDDY